METIDHLAILLVSGHQSSKLQDRLIEEGFALTEIDSFGGVLQEPTKCLLVGMNRDQMASLLEMVRQCCKPFRRFLPVQVGLSEGLANLPMVEVQLGGAIIYLLNVERFERI
jgi:uncharacterized protein YaaQ